MVQGVVIENGHIVDTNPATGDVIEKVPVATPDDVNAAISRAKAAQSTWMTVALDERIKLLKAVVAKLADDKKGLALLITSEMGKILAEANEEADFACDKNDFLDLVHEANLPVHCGGEKEGEAKCIIVREAHGVVAICSPWNFPADEILMLALPALAAGNTVVVKPSEVTPLTGAKVVQALQAVLPSGCAELVQGDGEVGRLLVGNNDVAMVAMTGSSATGRKIMEGCSPSLKRLVLELGGKDPMVVFADSDLEKAAEDAVTNSLSNCGQVCCSIERVYIEQKAKAEFEEKVKEKVSSYTAGNGMDESVKIGPLVSAMQLDLVKQHVNDAVNQGAKLLVQGKAPEGGNFFPATVLSDLKQDMTIQRAETFGPVVAIAEFDGSEAEAIRLANDSEYGLSACVYSKDLEKANRVAMRIRAGQVGVNAYALAQAHLKCPWVGHKGSGFGYHSGADGWRQFSVPKSIVMGSL